MLRFRLFLLFILLYGSVVAQQVSMSTYDKPMLTYAFSDPSPVMPLGRFYPYHRFDGFSMHGKMQSWKSVDLQNDQISLRILPEIGGKIWGAYHLKSGFPFIYHNDVVKFRDVAARGPWTSGGVELNFGDYGHAPSCATPVDYVTRENQDGSKSCFLSAFDWSSRTHWTVEVELKKEATYFTTKSTWSNMTPFAASNYQWMNAGFNASDDLEFLYPGNAYIDHDGKPFSWPVNEGGKNINFYKENNFGTYKSYHVLGETTDYFGGYWKKPDVGFIHYSPYHQKLGKKLWIWGLSRQGMIWEKLLTDSNGQYVELQSGRFYNQAGTASMQSPFKYNMLMPLQSDAWEEKWMTFAGVKGHTHAFEKGVLHIQQDSMRLFCHEPFEGVIQWVDGAGATFSRNVTIPAGGTGTFPNSIQTIKKVLLNRELIFDADQKNEVKRPFAMPESFDWETESGVFLKAKSLLAQRDVSGAMAALDRLLTLNPYHVDALVMLASVQLQQNSSEAEITLSKALSVNTYHGWANFYWGYYHFTRGDYTNAVDGFSVATTQQETKQIAFNYLAINAFRLGERGKAIKLANECLQQFPKTQESRYILMLFARGSEAHKASVSDLLAENPLDPIALSESYLTDRHDNLKQVWLNEMPHQNYIEAALWYAKLGLFTDARTLLEASPDNIMATLWLAYYQKKTGGDPTETLQKAASMEHTLAFPFRPEEFTLLQWAIQTMDKPVWHYLLGKLQWSKGQKEEAKSSIQRANLSNDVHYYLNKAVLWNDVTDTVRIALQNAYVLGPDNWRVVKSWTQFLLNKGETTAALDVIQQYQAKHPENYITGQVLAEAMFANQQFQRTADFLHTFESLPHEGASGLHQLFREACLFAALDNVIKKGKKAVTEKYLAMADTYPENLGSGKPYDVDLGLTNYIKQVMTAKSGTTPWTMASDATDFIAYMKLSSKEQKEAYIAQSFYASSSR